MVSGDQMDGVLVERRKRVRVWGSSGEMVLVDPLDGDMD